ncbi:tetratricopeptide repeat protein [Streptomyces sp. NPDC048111]|uniref:tetratricopeptide repeat protein n=1 Tax=Streptomyces sp. NPDC048111 TaxID=3365500 RepID=UPI00371210FC
MLDPTSTAAVAAVLGAVGAGLANEAGKAAWESAGGLVRRIVGREVRAPRSPAELDGIAQQVHDAVRHDPALARAWTAFARSAPTPGGPSRAPALHASTRFFTDRDAERKALSREASRRADGRPRVAVLHGPQGIGTSALALHWGCAELRRFPDGQLYADLRGSTAGAASGADPTAVLRVLLRQLGIPAEEIPPGRDDRQTLLRACTAERRMLIVLDHARSAAQILPVLTSAPGVFVIVAARHPLPGLDAVGIPVGPLSDKDARRLLAEVAKAGNIPLDRAALPAVLARCAGSPFALRAAAARLTARHWQQEGHLGDDAARTAVADSVAALAPDAARALRLLAQRDWPAFAAPMTAAVLGIDERSAVDVLHTLAAARLLESAPSDAYAIAGADAGVGGGAGGGAGAAGSDRGEGGANGHDGASGGHTPHADRAAYGMRPLIREYAAAEALREDGLEEADEAVRRAIRWCVDFAESAGRAALSQGWRLGEGASSGQGAVRYADPGQALAALRRELGNLLQAVFAAEELGDTDAVFRLNQALWPVQLKMGCHDELLPALRAGVRATEAGAPDSREAARMHTLLGLNLMELRQWSDAETAFTEAARVERAAGHIRGHATAVESLGLLRLREWRFAEAYDCFEAADRILDGVSEDGEGGRDVPRARALLERHRGRALRGLGRWVEAESRLESALAFFRATREPYNTARTLTDLAETFEASGRASAALSLLDEAATALTDEQAHYPLMHVRALRERCEGEARTGA